MSAHCNDCGTDLVHGSGDDWQLMTCPVCTLRDERDAFKAALADATAFKTRDALDRARELLGEEPLPRTEHLPFFGGVG